MKKLLLLAMVIGLLFLPFIVFALDKVDMSKICGINFGASEKEFESIGGKIVIHRKDGWSVGSMKVAREQGSARLVTVGERYSFFNGKFFFIEKKVPLSDFNFLKKQFTQKYGKPMAEKDAHGIEYSFVWKSGSVEICLYEYSNREAGVQYEYLPVSKEFFQASKDFSNKLKIEEEKAKKERYKNF